MLLTHCLSLFVLVDLGVDFGCIVGTLQFIEELRVRFGTRHTVYKQCMALLKEYLKDERYYAPTTEQLF